MRGGAARLGPEAFSGASDALLAACGSSSPDAQTIRRLLEGGADPNGQTGLGLCALMALCERPAPQARRCVRELLLAGADPGLADAEGEGALLKACRAGSVELARELLAAGASPSQRARSGLSPLAAAAESGEEELGWALLGAGALADDRSADGSPLLVSVSRLSEGAGWAQALLFHGADPERADARGWTPLGSAARAAARGPLRALLEAGADPLAGGPMGKSPLEIALGARAPEAAMGRSRVSPAHIHCAELMLEASGGAVSLDSLGLPPLIRLWRSIGRFEPDWMERLVLAGCRPAAADDDGDGLLHWASEGSEAAGLELARWALERGASPSRLSHGGQAAWERAVSRAKPRLAELLLSASEGAQLAAIEGSGRRSGSRSL